MAYTIPDAQGHLPKYWKAQIPNANIFGELWIEMTQPRRLLSEAAKRSINSEIDVVP